MKKRILKLLGLFLFLPALSIASEANLKIPDLNKYQKFGMGGRDILFFGGIIIFIGLLFGLIKFIKTKKCPVHKSMDDTSKTLYETCKTYLVEQGKFLIILFVIIGSAITYYYIGLIGLEIPKTMLILFWSVVGIAGSYSVAWYGIRINTYANSRTAFASIIGKPFNVGRIPLQAGMSIGIILVCVELIMMLTILLFVREDSAGACFVGFAIGESLGATVLRICGGIFTKIADIGSDHMKIIFKVKEDDPRNPGVWADCTGDNAGDSVGPTADGFETYGVTGVALIAFIVLGIPKVEFQATLIVWIFVMRLLMVFTSMFSYETNDAYSKAKFGKLDKFNFETPLTNLIWLTSIISIFVTFLASYILLPGLAENTDGTLWWRLATIISCGTLAAAVIPEFTKAFTSAKSRHVEEIVKASREGGASLTILSGLVAGNLSAFWNGMVIAVLMLIAYLTSLGLNNNIGEYAPIFSFGLVAFGFLGMGPVTIAVDSYGPITDNAQSIFELSQIENIPGIKEELQKDYGVKVNFEKAKGYLEENDSAGNTFKATAKPVLIGTAVVGATTMIFSIILLLKKTGMLNIELTNPYILLGFICGGAVVYWFTGASIQAVTTGASRAVAFIKKNMNLDKTEADIEDSKAVVKICTVYAQKGMWNIFIVLLSFTLAFAFFDPNFFVAYLLSLAVFGLFQAMYMANAGGAWDNAKKVVEVDLKEKNTPLHDASIVGDTVGDPYKDTSSVALNPIIKFSTLFGLLAVEIGIQIMKPEYGYLHYFISFPFFIIGLIFVYRSFYNMRIESK